MKNAIKVTAVYDENSKPFENLLIEYYARKLLEVSKSK